MRDIVITFKRDTGYRVVSSNEKEFPRSIYRVVSDHYILIRVSDDFDSPILKSVLDVVDKEGITSNESTEKRFEILKSSFKENLEVRIM